MTQRADMFGTEAGLISGDLYKLPNRRFIPAAIRNMACQGRNLQFLGGVHTDSIQAGGAGLTEASAVEATLSEFCERYSAACYGVKTFLYGSYNELSRRHRCLDPACLRLYADWQYDSEAFPIQRFQRDTMVNWVKAKLLLDQSDIYVPAFLVFMPYIAFGDDTNSYM